MPLTVVFDLDGTLVDTAPDLVDTLNAVLERAGYAKVPFDTAREFIGGGAVVMLERGLAAQGHTLDDVTRKRLYQEFLDHYADHVADRSRAFPGVDTALDELAQRGCRLAVCTNKLEWLSLRLLEQLGMTSRFAAICGQDTFRIAKPNPEVLRRTIGRAGGDLSQSIMIGDSITDISTARAAGIPVIAVDFGYTDTPVAQLGPDRVISHYDDLLTALAEVVPHHL